MNLLPFVVFAEEVTRERFEWGRIQTLSDWMRPGAAWALIAAVTAALLLFVIVVYRRDAVELSRSVAAILTGLRMAAVFGLLVLFLQPQWRTERDVVQNSRVAVLTDTSTSMGLTDSDGSVAPATTSRSRQVADALARTDFLNKLRKTHDVVVMRFDETVSRIATLAKRSPTSDGNTAATGAAADAPASDAGEKPLDERIDWEKAIYPNGNETRLGQALRQVVTEERGSPLSGIVVITDGGQNAGPPPEASVELAAEAKIPVFPVGVGSTRRPTNVQVYELEVPERAHPGDPFTVTGLIQSEGMSGQTVTVQLAMRDPSRGSENEQILQTEQLTLGKDGDAQPVKFQVTPPETGRRQIVLRVNSPKSDLNPADNQREADIEIVDRKNHVLLFAGGPSREYQFLKTLLYRDKSTTVDVLLQTGTAGISQEAAKILTSFPSTREEMFAYDCVLAFDPKWQALSPAQLELLETWVAEQGGGLVVVPGPVYAGQAINGWVQDPAMAKLRALYPVEFHRRASVVDAEAYTAKEAWPLEFTREGREAQFLWLVDNDTDNQQLWARFAGVFGCQPVRGVKPGAVVYARFADPQSGQGDKQPVYFAGQFYGSGRVFYEGSGEMWRLRALGEGHFEQFYTRLIRHVSQGRLLRQSSRGTLMVDKTNCLLGNTVQIRAQLTNAQLQPLKAQSVPLEVVLPDRSVQTITLRPDPNRVGLFAGQLTVLQEREYRLELPVPDSNERLTRRIQVRLPQLERENPQRNDSLLTRIADGTGGKYYSDMNAAWGANAADPLLANLKDRTKTSVLTSAPDPLRERTWLKWMMLTVCGLLCTEWLIRRLFKLA